MCYNLRAAGLSISDQPGAMQLQRGRLKSVGCSGGPNMLHSGGFSLRQATNSIERYIETLKIFSGDQVLQTLQHAASILRTNQDGGGGMAIWQKKQAEREEMDRMIQANPGIRPAELARLLDVSRSTIYRRLPGMEEAGFLYSEDERGGLWPFKRIK